MPAEDDSRDVKWASMDSMLGGIKYSSPYLSPGVCPL